MRALIQRVSHACITIDRDVERSIGRGYVVLLGIGHEDDADCVGVLWNKIARLRIFDDGNGKANLSLADIGGDVLIVSQFTLYANCRRGARPSFSDAARPDAAIPLYEAFIASARTDVDHVETGEFGADMQVELENDGPFTIWLDTDDLASGRR